MTRRADCPVLQHLAYVRLAVRASNYFDSPPVNPAYCQNRDVDLPISTDLSFPQRSSSCIQTDLNFPQRSSSCILRLDWPQLPATLIQRHLRLDHTSYQHRPSGWRPNTTTTNFSHTFVILTINYHPSCICFLAFVSFIVFGCQYLH